MLRSVFSGVRSQIRILRPAVIESAVRMESKKCTIDGEPPMMDVCSTNAAWHGRTDTKFDKCMFEASANKTPPCTTKAFEFFPCNSLKKKKNDRVQYAYLQKSMWAKPICCDQVEKEIRHDIEFLKDEYCIPQRTWSEFPARCKVKVPICKQLKVEVPNPERRPRGQVNKAATKQQPPIDLTVKCPKMRVPRCKKTRNTPKCISTVHPSCCKKRCTQFPSLSECCYKRPAPEKPSECGCHKSLSQCQANRYK